MQALTPSDVVSLWAGSKKYININGKRFSTWQENGQLCFLWGNKEIDLPISIFNEGDKDFIPELCRIISLIFWWPER